MTKIIDGKALAAKIKLTVKEKVQKYYIDKGLEPPCLACILVGDDKASRVYVGSKQKACAECGINSKVFELPADTSKEMLLGLLERLNRDKKVSSILVQLPLPKELDVFRDEIINSISPEKDVDCLTNINLGKIYAGTGEIAPCTATGIIKIFDSVGYDLEGKDVVVIGRSLLVGKSVSTLLQARNATVTNCHSRTKNLPEKTKRADAVVVAVGRAEMIDETYIQDGAFVVDVGINRVDGKLYGDVNFCAVAPKCSYITPVPGGVGPLTVACLMENTLILHEKAHTRVPNSNIEKDK